MPRRRGTRLSPETFERLSAELEELRTRARPEMARVVQEARALGRLSHNYDYQAVMDVQGRLEDRIRQLEAMLSDAGIVDPAVGHDGKIDIGVMVSLRYEGDDEVERYLIGSIEEHWEGVSTITPDSALGQALIGRKKGDRVEYETPMGFSLLVEIVEVG